MNVYPKNLKEEIISRMMPPNNESVPKLCKEYGISDASLYTWRKKAREAGYASPGNNQSSDKWNSEDKFLIVLETYTMNETELAEYCREKGLYREQIEIWKKACLTANGRDLAQTKQLNADLRSERGRSVELEKELRNKEKALAEAASLLLLQKKAQAIWGDEEED
jgi:transposase-like protein